MEPLTNKAWLPRIDGEDSPMAAELSEALQLSPLVSRLLVKRGLCLETARLFLAARLADLPDPMLLPDMDAAVCRIVTAIEDGERIAVHGDYDVDGITATAMLFASLCEMGCSNSSGYHIPLRLSEGYGLSAVALKAAAGQGVKLVISVDCGVSAHAEADLARECGVDLIITDHHQPPETLPEAVAVINPKRQDSSFPFVELAGVGVAFFLLIAVRKRLRDSGWFEGRVEPDLRACLDLVAMGTIADLVPLQGVNRALVRHGLTHLQKAPRTGIKALRQVAGVSDITSTVVGFQLAPRLNAAGRMENAELGVELLLEQDLVRALNSARYLDQCNLQRREIERQTLQEAELMITTLGSHRTHSIVLAKQGWHPGVIGIVASRLVERYGRPTVMIAMDGANGKGSCRSIKGFNLFHGLQACATCLNAFGGHEMAAGLSLEQDKLDKFSASFEDYARTKLTADDLLPAVSHDGSLLLEELDMSTMAQLQKMAPFGMGNPEPVMLVESVRAMQLQPVGTQHLRFTVCQGAYSHAAIAFGMLDRRDEFLGEIDLLVVPQINRYRERDMVQLRVKDVRPARNIASQ